MFTLRLVLSVSSGVRAFYCPELCIWETLTLLQRIFHHQRAVLLICGRTTNMAEEDFSDLFRSDARLSSSMLTATMLTSSLVRQFLCVVHTFYLRVNSTEEDPEHVEDPGDLNL